MGDKSPKSIQRGLKQKGAARAQGTAAAKSKQDSQNHSPQTPSKSKR